MFIREVWNLHAYLLSRSSPPSYLLEVSKVSSVMSLCLLPTRAIMVKDMLYDRHSASINLNKVGQIDTYALFH